MLDDSLVKAALHGRGNSDPHLLTLFALVISLRAKRILELGVKDGNTTRPLLKAASLIPGAHVTSVDNNVSLYKPPVELQNLWSFVLQDSVSYLTGLAPSAIFDLVYLDNWHAYQHVKQELECLDLHITPSSLILIHDTMYGNTQPVYHTDLTLKEGQWANGGPYRAVAELNPQFWEFSTIPVAHGLTILRKKYTNWGNKC